KTLGGWKYSLPTEAQWEYACRGGVTSYKKYHFGDTISTDDANYDGKLGRTAKVGSYAANAFGLKDMHGNVWESCSDWYAADYYKASRRRDPPGPSQGAYGMIRGGSWYDDGHDCRSAYRNGNTPGDRHFDVGFRAALVLPAGQDG